MKEFSFQARLYILSVSILGVLACFLSPMEISGVRLLLFVAVAVITSFTQMFQVEGVVKDSSYNASVFGYSLAFIALGQAEASWIVIVSFVAAWLWKKRVMPWYALGFNIGSTTIPLAIASLAYNLINQGQTFHGFLFVAGTILAGFIYILFTQLMGGLVFWLVDGKGLSESGYLSRLILIMEATQFAMGVAAALIWEINPYALVFAISPLYLIHLTLQLPTLQVRAETDAKTGLYNARFFNTALEKELLRADRADYPLSVAMGDLDYLRNINNSHGHLAGDMAIITIANTIKKLVRNYDIVARFGGEEFAILMPETPLKRAAARVEEIRLAIENTVIDLPTTGAYLRVTMSFGIAEREHPGQKPSEVIHNADVALYQAKQSGRNKVCRSKAEDLQQKLVP